MAMRIRFVIRVNGRPALSADCVHVGQPGDWTVVPVAFTPAELVDRVYGEGLRPAFDYDRITVEYAIMPEPRRWWRLRRRDRL